MKGKCKDFFAVSLLKNVKFPQKQEISAVICIFRGFLTDFFIGIYRTY